ncbi:hypothetical protein PC9H_000248 [Pleurotus ostreatus]|uniref:Mucoidy inhibitor A n=1 Tax=Pleurotus ostreatus TaxID=5322 RepID=A0A8H7DZ68_PLEOS|nr:uncharacterized protein PC9H_000248 [Pleurotus ostreatus]KAF7439911.1 hypothetical protein PC9H_000248 [Pleurotus ostreatus]KAJ8700893.1 hypothetical protein PTI98_003873 [Pleurotus ostreatus]
MQDQPPSFDAVNVLELRTADVSKILKVSVYTNLAEITRLYKFKVKTGQNQVKINGLPDLMDSDSLRVEARGPASIQGVSTGPTPTPPVPTTSQELKKLQKEKRLVENAIERCKASIAALRSYVSSVSADRVPSENLGQLLQHCETEGERLASKLLELEDKLTTSDAAIEAEQKRLSGADEVDTVEYKLDGSDGPGKLYLGLTASIGLFANEEGDVELTLIYAVHQATWRAGYDVRVDMQAKDTPVVLTYKAIIHQTTGESWTDVPLTLETVAPTYGAHIPTLSSWPLSVYAPAPPSPIALASYASAAPGGFRLSRKTTRGAFQADIVSQGALSATYQVPGLITIPTDGQNHSVTIVELELGAEMSWIVVPKLDKRVHLKAKIKNASEYTLLPGEGSIYVDGSFISKSNIPSVGPQGSFDCSLGVDPSIDVTYHPLSKNISKSGFYTKNSKYSYNQRITVSNTKTKPVDNLKIVDRIPISEDSQITVKLISPSLSLPSSGTDTVALSFGNADKAKDAAERPLMPPVKVSSGVAAQWDGADDPQGDITALGKDGKLNWLCSIPPQSTTNVSLQWEVESAANITITGL